MTMRAIKMAFFSALFIFVCLINGSANASLVPFLDPFGMLEQSPLGLLKEHTNTDPLNGLLPPARADWKETPDGHIIRLDVPGLAKVELKIELDDNRILKVMGERKREEEREGDHWHRVERSYGKFWRQFRMPADVDLDSVKASLENGVLTVTVPKLSPEKIKGPRVVGISTEASPAAIKSGEARQEL